LARFILDCQEIAAHESWKTRIIHEKQESLSVAFLKIKNRLLKNKNRPTIFLVLQEIFLKQNDIPNQEQNASRNIFGNQECNLGNQEIFLALLFFKKYSC